MLIYSIISDQPELFCKACNLNKKEIQTQKSLKYLFDYDLKGIIQILLIVIYFWAPHK
jgi:hypothetical protein